MADDGNEDSWLYGSKDEEGAEASSTVDGESGDAKKADAASQDEAVTGGSGGEAASADESSNAKSTPANGADPMETGEPEEVVPNPADEMEEADREDGERLSGEEAENSESEEDDDDINVVIGDIKSGPNYNIKQRSGAAAAGTAPATDKGAKQAPGGKFSMEEFESVGTINGTPSHEFSIDSLDEKPWRKPGADITDYFNYGFNEDTWRMYCERQKRMRQNESGVGLQGLMVAPVMMSHNQVDRSAGPGGRTLTPIANDNSKYGALTALPVNRRAGPPPGRRMTGAIDVIGGNGVLMGGKHENAIQVMTAERREYSRPGMPSGGKFDMPPPVFPPGGVGGPPGSGGIGGGPPGRNMGPVGGPENTGPIIDAFQDEFSYGYEPTQDSQWGAGHGNQGWAPTGIKELTPMMPQMVPAPGMGGMGMPPEMGGMPPGMQGVPPPQQRYPSDRGPSDRDRSMRGERSEREREARERGEREARERGDRERGDRERSERAAEKERGGSDRRSERESSRRRDRSRSRERSRRRSKSKEKTSSAATTASTSSSSSKHRSERSSRTEKRDKDEPRKEKKREGKDDND